MNNVLKFLISKNVVFTVLLVSVAFVLFNLIDVGIIILLAYLGMLLGSFSGHLMFPKVDLSNINEDMESLDMESLDKFTEMLKELERTYTDDLLWWTMGNLEYRPGSMFWEKMDNEDEDVEI